MKVNSYHEIVNVYDGNSLLIHTLTGEILVLTSQETLKLRNWLYANSIKSESSEDQEMIFNLAKSNFIVQDDYEEHQVVNNLLIRCRERHNQIVHKNISATFVVTYSCNFACPYCYEHASEYVNNAILTEEMVDKVFDLYNHNIKRIGFFGGEPFLPETRRIIEYIVSRAPDAIFSVTTNGYYISEYIDLLNQISIDHIMITLDGSKETHNKTRKLFDGQGTFDRIMDGIKSLLVSKIRVKIRMNISPSNLDECLCLREDLITDYTEYYKSGKLMFELQPIFQLSTRQKDLLNEKIVFDPSNEKALNTKYNLLSLSVSSILQSFVNNRVRGYPAKYCSCTAGSTARFFDPEGRIYSCILSLKNEEASIGTYYPEYQIFEKSMLDRNIETIDECTRCKFRFLCGGGCALSVIDASGNVMKPNCSIKREIYEVLPTLYEKYTKNIQQ